MFLKKLTLRQKNALNKIIIAFVFVIQQLSNQDLLQANISLHGHGCSCFSVRQPLSSLKPGFLSSEIPNDSSTEISPVVLLKSNTMTLRSSSLKTSKYNFFSASIWPTSECHNLPVSRRSTSIGLAGSAYQAQPHH